MALLMLHYRETVWTIIFLGHRIKNILHSATPEAYSATHMQIFVATQSIKPFLLLHILKYFVAHFIVVMALKRKSVWSYCCD